MIVVTFKSILIEYELLAVMEEINVTFEEYLRENYTPVYDEECNFKGYQLNLDEGVGYDTGTKRT